MDALVARHLDAVEDVDDAERDARASVRFKKLRRTDPDATVATSPKAPLRPPRLQVEAFVMIDVAEADPILNLETRAA